MTPNLSSVEAAASAVRSSSIVGDAMKLADWLGDGKRKVTPSGVPRKPDVPEVAAVLGVTVPARFRSASDIPGIRRPWTFAVAAGMIRVENANASAAGLDLAAEDDAEILERWTAGLLAVLAEESDPRETDAALILALAVAVVPPLVERGELSGPFWELTGKAVFNLTEASDRPATWHTGERFGGFGRRTTAMPGLVRLLAQFGMVADENATVPSLTALGEWAREPLALALPLPEDPHLSPEDLVTRVMRFESDEDRHTVSWAWLEHRPPEAAVRELLSAAATMTPGRRIVAAWIAEGAGEAGNAAWQAMTDEPNVGPHAKLRLWHEQVLKTIPRTDLRWLAVENAAAALAADDPDEALTLLWDELPGDDLDETLAAARATGHPDADTVVKAVEEFVASGAPRSVDQVLQLKVTLTRHGVWRSVQIPAIATLDDLHEAIRAMFDWDWDHAHVFGVGNQHYSGPFMHLEETGFDTDIRVGAALSKAKKISYLYDMGASWEHEITLEERLRVDPDRDYPFCVGFAGDNVMEYPDSEFETPPGPFDVDQVNRRLNGRNDSHAAGSMSAH